MPTTVHRAREFALKAHADQRYGPHPYSYHLDAVAELCQPYGETAQTIAYLHDVVEDTPVPLETIREEFGELVAACVALLTDFPGPTRADRKVITHKKLAAVTPEHHLALIVKAADRLANVRMSCQSQNQKKLAMYRTEHPAFKAAAHRPQLSEDLWTELDHLLEMPDVV